MSLYDIAVTGIDGQQHSMADYRGHTLLIVNVASHCGMTPQYAGLEALWRRYRERGLVVLGFPCDQFAGQEPGTEEEIASFCQREYDVTFPMFAKIDVNGDGTHPLFAHLKAAKPGVLGTEAVKWNFTKFLVSADGTVCERFSPKDEPASIEKDIVAVLPPAPTASDAPSCTISSTPSP
jgi:glutathione peroxidase